jgi:hypothetical protein
MTTVAAYCTSLLILSQFAEVKRHLEESERVRHSLRPLSSNRVLGLSRMLQQFPKYPVYATVPFLIQGRNS